MESLSFQYPSWYFALCILLGLLFAFGLYIKDKKFEEQPSWLPYVLGFMRFLSGTAIAALLLSPLLKSVVTEQKEAIVVIAQDNTSSIKASMSDEDLASFSQSMEDLKNELSENYTVESLSFGSGVNQGISNDFEGKVTNMNDLFDYVFDAYSNQNLGAVIMATDGIYNEGRNPLYSNHKFTAPFHVIALGDTVIKKDLLLKQVFHNKLAYLGDQFAIQMDIKAKNCIGNKSNLDVFLIDGEQQTKLKSIPVDINSNDFFRTEELLLEAQKSGINHYRISLSGVSGETSRVNNSKDIFVEILDARQKILVYANAPHPDISSLKMGLSQNKNYEVEVIYAKDGIQNSSQYDFVIFHDLPSKKYSIQGVVTQINQTKTPRFFIVGNNTVLAEFNNIQDAVSISGNNNNSNPSQPLIADNFSLFTISNTMINQLETFVPLICPFGTYEMGVNTEILLYQKIGKVDTKYPLLMFNNSSNIKTGVLAGEGIWRWRLFDFMEDNNHDVFNEVLSKSIQYVSLKDDKRKFRVNTSANVYKENEKLLFTAEVYNDSYEMINDPEVFITISNSKGENFPFTFSRTNNYYRLDAGIFQPGRYNYNATVNHNGKEMKASGKFSIRSIQLELYDMQARHGLLRNISEKFGGQVYYPDQMEELKASISGENTIKPIIYQNSKTRSIINLKWIFGILLGFLCLEWFLRRYFGTY